MARATILNIINSMVPISRFNKGEASKIFDEVASSGTKIVIKNNRPACVLLSPAQYESLIEMLSDSLLYTEAEKRMATNNDSETLSYEAVMEELGITQEELDDIDVEIE